MTFLFRLFLILSSLLTVSCSRTLISTVYEINHAATNRFAKNLAPLPGQFEKDIAALNTLITAFSDVIEAEWGKNQIHIADKLNYVKYTNNYQSRARIDFTNGRVIIETVATSEPKAQLKKAIVTTLLTPDDPSAVDLFSAADVPIKGNPFLRGQILDQDKKEITWQWRAEKFADYLIANHLKHKMLNFQKVFYIEIPMVKDHSQKRRYQYAHLVQKAAKRYDISEELIYAIIKAESDFNPYAVSPANAYGLMQVVPQTAGRDVFKLIKNRKNDPSPSYLFNPAKNIDIGTAYFSILKNRYLKEVTNPLSLHYSMISAYNGGAGNVLKTFHSDRKQAIKNINRLQPKQIYWALTNKHPMAESKKYLQKVSRFQKNFRSLN